MALMICKHIDGCRWMRANEPTHRKVLAPRLASCRTLVFSFGQHDLGWPNGYPTPPVAFSRSIRRLLAEHAKANGGPLAGSKAAGGSSRGGGGGGGGGGGPTFLLSMNYIPLNCIITTCPPSVIAKGSNPRGSGPSSADAGGSRSTDWIMSNSSRMLRPHASRPPCFCTDWIGEPHPPSMPTTPSSRLPRPTLVEVRRLLTSRT